jgi:hypothetical protein
MPTEYYVGIAIALILIGLLGLLFKPRRDTRRLVQQKQVETDQLAKQLSRIADSLELLVTHLGASATLGKLPVEKPVIEERPIEELPIEKPLVQERPVENIAAEKPLIPVENAVQPSDTNEEKVEQPPERHVRLSMFGR